MFTEMFVKKAVRLYVSGCDRHHRPVCSSPPPGTPLQDNVTLLLSLLHMQNFHVRLNTVKLLTILVANRAAHLQVLLLPC